MAPRRASVLAFFRKHDILAPTFLFFAENGKRRLRGSHIPYNAFIPKKILRRATTKMRFFAFSRTSFSMGKNPVRDAISAACRQKMLFFRSRKNAQKTPFFAQKRALCILVNSRAAQFGKTALSKPWKPAWSILAGPLPENDSPPAGQSAVPPAGPWPPLPAVRPAFRLPSLGRSPAVRLRSACRSARRFPAAPPIVWPRATPEPSSTFSVRGRYRSACRRRWAGPPGFRAETLSMHWHRPGGDAANSRNCR